MDLPKLKKRITLEHLLSREDVYDGGKYEYPKDWNAFSPRISDGTLRMSITRCSNWIHRSSLRFGANIVIVHEENKNLFFNFWPRLSNKWKRKSAEDSDVYLEVPNVDIEDVNGPISVFGYRYWLYTTKNDIMKGKILVARAADGCEYSPLKVDEGGIPEIEIKVAQDERFFVGNLAEIALLKVV